MVCLVLAAVLGFSVFRWLNDDDVNASSPSTPDPSSSESRSSGPSSSAGGPTSGEASPSAPESANPPPKATPAPGRPGWQALRTPDGWAYQVPKGAEWTSSQDVLAYVDRSGKTLVRATQPSYLHAGACRNPGSVARGVVGWATPEAGTNSAEVAKNWATAVAVDDDGSQDQMSRVVTRPVRNASLEVEHSVILVRSTNATGCLPRQVQVSATSYRGEGGTRILVIVRELGVDGAMSTSVKTRIVHGVTHSASRGGR